MNERQTDSAPGKRARARAFVAIGIFVALLAGLFVCQPDNLYLWIKALHIIAVMSWMAALLYMPRLFIYHTDAAPGSEQSETFKMMERRLLKVIMNPAMMITWVLGSLSRLERLWVSGWVAACEAAARRDPDGRPYPLQPAVAAFARDENRRSARYWRLMNEAPTVLMILIVIMAVVKPF